VNRGFTIGGGMLERHELDAFVVLAGVPVLPPTATFQEALMLVGAGQGVLPVGAHVRRYCARPDVSYVPFRDAPPVEWGLAWPRGRATARVLAFTRAAEDLIDRDE
jgi:hypothetical protein